jgi:hypothetical protein
MGIQRSSSRALAVPRLPIPSRGSRCRLLSSLVFDNACWLLVRRRKKTEGNTPLSKRVVPGDDVNLLQTRARPPVFPSILIDPSSALTMITRASWASESGKKEDIAASQFVENGTRDILVVERHTERSRNTRLSILFGAFPKVSHCPLSLSSALKDFERLG